MNIEELNNIINQQDVIDICKIFHLTTAKYIFFLSVHGTLINIDHILGHKIKLDKFERKEIIPSVLQTKN